MGHKGGAHRYYAPGNQNTRYPFARAKFMQGNIAGDLKKKIPNKKDTGEHAKLSWINTQLFIHLQRGIADVGPVQIGNGV
nr:hypothetical protein [Sodalis praecaptivus]